MTVTAPSSRLLFAALLLLSRPCHGAQQSPPSSSSTVPDTSTPSDTTNTRTTAQILTRDAIPALTGALDAGDLVECYALTRFARLKVPPPPSPPPVVRPPPDGATSGEDGGDGDGDGDDRGRRRRAAKTESWNRVTSTGTDATNSTAPTPAASPPTPSSSSGSGPLVVRKSALGFRYKPARHAPSPGESGAKPPFELTLEYGPQRTGADMDGEAMPQIAGGLGEEDEEEGMFVSWQNEGKIYYESTIDPTRWETADYMAPITGAVMSKILDRFVVEYTMHHPRYQPFEVYDVAADRVVIHSSSSDDFVWHLFERLASLYVNLSPILTPVSRKLRLYVNTSDVVQDGAWEGGAGGGKVAEKVDAALAGRDAAEFMDRFYRCGYAVKNGESTEVDEGEDDGGGGGEKEEGEKEEEEDSGAAQAGGEGGNGNGSGSGSGSGNGNGTLANDASTSSLAPGPNATLANGTVAGNTDADGGGGEAIVDPAETPPRPNSTDGVSSPPEAPAANPPPPNASSAILPSAVGGGGSDAANSSTAGPDVGGRDSDVAEGDEWTGPDPPPGDDGGSDSFDGGGGGNGNGTGVDNGGDGGGGTDGEDGGRRMSLQTAPHPLGGDGASIASALSQCLSSTRFGTDDGVAYLFLDGANFYRLRLSPPYLEALTVHEALPEPQRLSEGQGDFVDWTLALLIIGGIVFGLYMILLQLGAVRPRGAAECRGCLGWLGLGGFGGPFGGVGMTNANGEATSSRHSGGGISLGRFGEGAPHSWGEDAIPLSMGGRAPPAGPAGAWHAHQMQQHDLKGGIAKGLPPLPSHVLVTTVGERREDAESDPRRRDVGTEGEKEHVVGPSAGDVGLMPVRNGLHSMPGSGRTSPVTDFPGGGGDPRRVRADSIGHASEGRLSIGGGSLNSRSSSPDNEDEIMLRHMQLHMQRNHRDLVALPDLTTGSRVAVPVGIADRPAAAGGQGTVWNGRGVKGKNDEFDDNHKRSCGRIPHAQGQGINT